MDVNDDEDYLNKRGAFTFFASRLAEHCKQEPTQQRAGYGSQKHIYFWASACTH